MKSLSLRRLYAHCTLLAVLTLLVAAPAGAATLTFTDQGLFMAQVQPGYYLEDFAGLASGSLGVSSLNFSGNGFAYTASVLNTTLYGGNVGSRNLSTDNSAVGNILSLTFTSGNVFAVGGNFFYDNDSGSAAGVDVLISLNDGTNLTLPLATTSSFGGFISDTAILSLSFNAGGPQRFPAMDNIVVGQSSLAAVPEPGSILLVFGGFAGLVALRRRR